MSNYITASVEFYFRGKKIAVAIELDLDQHMKATGKIPELFPLLARASNLDVYSYEYEMMQAENIAFSDAKGLADDFISDGILDIEAFETAWAENDILKELENIAQKHLSIDDLTKRTDIKNALLQAYQLGKK